MNNQKLLQLKLPGAFLLSLMLALPVFAQDEAEGEAPPPKQVLIKNVNIFDGFDDRLQDGMDVLVEENFIKEVGKSISAPGAEVIDGGGRTMTPGQKNALKTSLYTKNFLKNRDCLNISLLHKQEKVLITYLTSSWSEQMTVTS